MARKQHRTEFKAFAAFNDRGSILYATIRRTKAEALETLHKLNPPVDGYHYPFRVMPVYVGLDTAFQYDIEDAIKAAAAE